VSAISDDLIDIPQQLPPKSHDVMVISHGLAFRHLSTGFGNEASPAFGGAGRDLAAAKLWRARVCA
jgi:hypothetical protein